MRSLFSLSLHALALASLALAAPAALSQSVGSFRDAGSGRVDFTRAVMDAREDCTRLGQRVKQVEGTRLTVLSAQSQPATAGLPAFCRVVAMLDPEVLVEVALPLQWNGRLYMRGNGGYAGERLDAPVRVSLRDEALRRGFVAAQTNTGHDAVAQPLGAFAQNDLAKMVDYSFRAVHLTAQAGKDLAAAFYGSAPRRSYFDGCSTGGRQGLMAAQRYPGDFDGIAAGAPVLNFTGTMYNYVNYAGLVQKAGFTAATLSALGRAVVERCDAADGLRDGIINDPRQCKFDPRADMPRCPANGPCLTADQITALETFHSDQRHQGRVVFPAWPWGSEAPDASGTSGWAEWIVSIPPSPNDAPSARQALPSGETRQTAYAQSFLRYFADLPASRPDAEWRTFNLETGFRARSFVGDLLDARQADLSAFKARGGKMITYHGWADPALNPMMAVNYYEEASRATPGLQDSYRLFMVPGLQHCNGGDAPNVLDAVSALVDWVEGGQAPTSLLATQKRANGSTRSRPVCAYPQVATYTQGDPDQASSFTCR